MKLTYDEVIEKAMPQIRKAFEEGQVKYGDPDIGNLDKFHQRGHIQGHMDHYFIMETHEENEDGTVGKHHLGGVVARCMMLIVRDEMG